MHNACTRVGCDGRCATRPLIDKATGTAWGHACPQHFREYEALMAALNANNGRDYSPEKLHAIIVRAAGGEEAWSRYVSGPFSKGNKQRPKVLAGTGKVDGESATT